MHSTCRNAQRAAMVWSTVQLWERISATFSCSLSRLFLAMAANNRDEVVLKGRRRAINHIRLGTLEFDLLILILISKQDYVFHFGILKLKVFPCFFLFFFFFFFFVFHVIIFLNLASSFVALLFCIMMISRGFSFLFRWLRCSCLVSIAGTRRVLNRWTN